jgi:hypothetical protein
MTGPTVAAETCVSPGGDRTSLERFPGRDIACGADTPRQSVSMPPVSVGTIAASHRFGVAVNDGESRHPLMTIL